MKSTNIFQAAKTVFCISLLCLLMENAGAQNSPRTYVPLGNDPTGNVFQVKGDSLYSNAFTHKGFWNIYKSLLYSRSAIDPVSNTQNYFYITSIEPSVNRVNQGLLDLQQNPQAQRYSPFGTSVGSSSFTTDSYAALQEWVKKEMARGRIVSSSAIATYGKKKTTYTFVARSFDEGREKIFTHHFESEKVEEVTEWGMQQAENGHTVTQMFNKEKGKFTAYYYGPNCCINE